MAKVLNGVETLPKISTMQLSRVHERYRQTDNRRTTDGRATVYSEHECEFMFAKNRYQ